jgi:hypothetical protein
MGVGLVLLAAGAAQAAETEASKAQGEKRVCKSVAETGSLVKKTKVCLSQAEWQRSGDKHRDYGRDLQQKLMSKQGGQ